MNLIIVIFILIAIDIIAAVSNANGAQYLANERERKKRVDELMETQFYDAKPKFVEKYSATKDEEFNARNTARIWYHGHGKEVCDMLQKELGFRPNVNMIALAILLEGDEIKMPKKVAEFGFTGGAMIGKSIDDGIVDEFKFLRWYDKQLRDRGFPYKLLFVGKDWSQENNFYYTTQAFLDGDFSAGKWVGEDEFAEEFCDTSRYRRERTPGFTRIGQYWWTITWEKYINPADGYMLMGD